MAQSRIYNYLEDDLTAILNRWKLGSIPYGRYAGFEWNGAAPLLATFVHTATGLTIVNSDSPITTTPNVGEWKTKQGGVIREDAPITALFTANPSADKRLDILVGQHAYIDTAGGAFATYLVIAGTPSPSPTVPALTLPNEQVILGYMDVPAGATDLSNAIWHSAAIPNFGNDGTIAHTDRPQTFSENQVIGQFSEEWGVCYYDSGVNILFLDKDASGTPLTGDALRRNRNKNKFFLGVVSGTPITIMSISPYRHTFNYEAKSIEIFTLTALILDSSTFIDSHLENSTIPAASIVKLTTLEDTTGVGTLTDIWTVNYGSQAKIDAINLFNKQQGWQKATGTLNAGTQQIVHGYDANFIEVATTGINRTVRFIQPSRGNGGTFLVIKATGTPLLLVHKDAGVATKKLWLPAGIDMLSNSDNEVFLFVEDVNYWRLVGTYNNIDSWHIVGDVTTGLGTAFVDYSNGGGGSPPSPLKFKRETNGKVSIKGWINKNVLTNNTANDIFTLPIGYRPVIDTIVVVYGNNHIITTGASQFQTPCYLNISSTGLVEAQRFNCFEVLAAPPAQQHCVSNLFIDIEFTLG